MRRLVDPRLRDILEFISNKTNGQQQKRMGDALVEADIALETQRQAVAAAELQAELDAVNAENIQPAAGAVAGSNRSAAHAKR